MGTTENGVRFVVRGSGPAIVLVAGVGSTVRLWGELPDLLGRRFTVVTFDNRGVGGSRRASPFTLDAAADDVADVVSAAGLDRAGLVGVSMGGAIACLAAARHPGVVSRLVAISSGIRLDAHQRRVLLFFQQILTHMPPLAAADCLMTFAFGPAFTTAYPGFVDEAARAWAPESEDLEGARNQVTRLLQGFDLAPHLASIRCPALVAAGTRDPLVPPEASAELAAAILDARFVRVADAGHSVLAEGGSAFLETLTSFLSRE